MSESTVSEPEHQLLSLFGTLLLAVVLILFVINFVFRAYAVDGISMESTLQSSDRLVIWKVPRSWADVTGHAYIPQRGDIIVINEGGLNAFGQTPDTKQIIKRVIGLPGDRVVLKDGHYTIYNQTNPGGFNPDLSLAYGKSLNQTTPGETDVTLGPNQLFVSGDNRGKSLDSRSFGPINANQIVGKLILRLAPVKNARAF